MTRRLFVVIFGVGSKLASAQDPRIEAGKVLVQLLLPTAQDQIKKWLGEKPALKQPKVVELYTTLQALDATRERYAVAIKEYLKNLRYGPETDRNEKRLTAIRATAAMMQKLRELGSIFDSVTPTLKIFNKQLDDALAVSFAGRFEEVRLVDSLAGMSANQRANFEQQLDLNTETLKKNLRELSGFIKANYKFDEIAK